MTFINDIHMLFLKMKLHVASVAVKQNRYWHRDQIQFLGFITHQRPSPKEWIITNRQQWKRGQKNIGEEMSEASAVRGKTVADTQT